MPRSSNQNWRSRFSDKLGFEPLEGYGCTETGPVVAVNLPDPVTARGGRTVPGNRPGTVGIPLPGTAVRVVDPETGADLPVGSEGLIHVKGPQIMVGYLNRPEETARVLRDGWYNTGDLGCVDEDGFLKITDRLSRFSKIGGEMVPHQKVESAIIEASGGDEQHIAVTSVPDAKRGERLAVVYSDLAGKEPEEVCRALQAIDDAATLDPVGRTTSSGSRPCRSSGPANSTSGICARSPSRP